jgi:hypothetical protein
MPQAIPLLVLLTAHRAPIYRSSSSEEHRPRYAYIRSRHPHASQDGSPLGRSFPSDVFAPTRGATSVPGPHGELEDTERHGTGGHGGHLGVGSSRGAVVGVQVDVWKEVSGIGVDTGRERWLTKRSLKGSMIGVEKEGNETRQGKGDHSKKAKKKKTSKPTTGGNRLLAQLESRAEPRGGIGHRHPAAAVPSGSQRVHTATSALRIPGPPSTSSSSTSSGRDATSPVSPQPRANSPKSMARAPTPQPNPLPRRYPSQPEQPVLPKSPGTRDVLDEPFVAVPNKSISAGNNSNTSGHVTMEGESMDNTAARDVYFTPMRLSRTYRQSHPTNGNASPSKTGRRGGQIVIGGGATLQSRMEVQRRTRM